MVIAPPLWVSVSLIVLPVAAGAGLGLRIRDRRPDLTVGNALRRLPALWGFLGVALLLPISLGILVGNERLALKLPLAFQYWGPIVLWSLFLLSVGFLNSFGVGLAYAGAHAERSKLLIAATLLGGALAFVQFYYPRPLAPALKHEADRDGTILQSSDASCAPAAGANIARALGVEVREPAVARVMGTTRMFGTSVPQIVIGMRELGIDCTTVVDETADARSLPLPAFLFVDHWAVGREGHVVALMGRTDKGYEVIDPLAGRELWNPEKMREDWHGLAVSCRRAPGRT